MTFKRQLEEMRACPNAIDWVGDKTIEAAWDTCARGDWMLWLAGRVGVDRKTLVLVACDCAELADEYLCDRTRKHAHNAIATARDWCEGKASLQDVRKAADAAAACAAAYAACAYAAAYADAAAAADAYAVAATTATAAADAAHTAAAADAREATLAKCATIVRKHITARMVIDAMKEVP